MNELLFLIIVILFGFVTLGLIIIYELRKLKPTNDQAAILEWLRSVEQSLRGSTTDVTRALSENSKQLNDRLDLAARVIGDLKGSLGEMSEVGRGIKNLQEFLQSPKLRGNIGEQVLADMIGQTFPKKSFHLQYGFKSGVKVDAALQTDAGILCIDSKFPLENFMRMHEGETEKERLSAKKEFIGDVRKHISDISNKYILPDEGTLDFALMYIPSESVYYEIANLPEVMNYSRRERVYPVSPNTLYAHLQVLLLSFQGKELEDKSRQVFQLLRALAKDYGKVEENLSTLGRHINNAHNSMSLVSTSFGLLGQKLQQAQTIDSPQEVQIELK